MSRKASRGGNEEDDYLRQGLGHEKLPIKAMKESSGLRQRAPCRDNRPFPPPLSPLINKLSKVDFPAALIY
jgi:hypothetical protein